MAARAGGTKSRGTAPSQPPPRNEAEAAELRRKAATPSRAAARQEAPGPDDPMDADVFAFEPLRLSAVPDEGVRQIPLFYVGAEPWMIPAQVRIDIGVRMLDILLADLVYGEARSQQYMFVKMLGEDGYEALVEHVRDPADYEKVGKILARLTIGAAEKSPKESPNG